MVMRDLCYRLTTESVTDEYAGKQIIYKKGEHFYANVRIFFSYNEDGITNRQGIHHLEGALVTMENIDNVRYVAYDNHIFELILRNPQSKLYLYKIREVSYKDGQLQD